MSKQAFEKMTVHIIDDDEAVRKSICWLLESINLDVKPYKSAESFLESYSIYLRGCLLVDIRMPSMSGLQLQQKLNKYPFIMPIIFITGHGDVPMAVQAMKNGAYDFIEKPFNEQVLLDRIQLALQQDEWNCLRRLDHYNIKQRLTTLTRREYEVLLLILQKKSSKQLAHQLNISIKTVEAHRSHVLEKMEVSNSQELIEIMKIYPLD